MTLPPQCNTRTVEVSCHLGYSMRATLLTTLKSRWWHLIIDVSVCTFVYACVYVCLCVHMCFVYWGGGGNST